MEVKSQDICIILGYRLTEYKIHDGEDIVTTYFNIRDDRDVVHGPDYDDIAEPLNLLLSIENTVVKNHLSIIIGDCDIT